MRNSFWAIAGTAVLFARTETCPALSQQATTSAPVSPPKEIRAARATGPISVDGRLDEPDWERAESAQGFFQIQPNQGLPLQADPQVRVLYDDKNLYLATYSPDSLGRRGIRVPDLRAAAGAGDWKGDLSEAVLIKPPHLSGRKQTLQTA